ncbi:MAG: hypothetical protein QG657_471 [Acidobacteriota bacterium]|nr:hypothetical protein [Acidobacteriota bacterium]
MIRKMILILVVLLMLTVGLTAGDTKGQKPDMKRTFDIPGDGPGYDLLRLMADEVVEMFKGFEHFNAVSDKWIIQARTAKDKGLVDGIFFERYKQLAVVLKLLAVPDEQKVGILSDLIVEEINKFGVDPLPESFEFNGMGSVAAKLTEEILSLKSYLDKQGKH